ncbi:MAG: peptidase domain-containing ABC transporter [Agriterribacter sp.]
MKKYPFYKQFDQKDCGPTCLRMISKYHGKNIPREYLYSNANITKEGVSLAGIAEAAEKIGFRSLPVNIDYKTLYTDAPLPCIAFWRQRHFVVIYKVEKKNVIIGDPSHGIIKYTNEEFLKGWTSEKNTNNFSEKEGVVLLLEPTPSFFEHEEYIQTDKPKIRYFSTYFKPYKKYIFQLLIGLVVGSLIQLVIPFLTQSMIDNGIITNNLNFIQLIFIAQLVLFISRASVEVVRNWLILHITTKVNINFISDFLIKLMKLPIKFFDSKTTGDLLQRIDDHQRIENFISTTTLNTLFSFINVVIFGAVLFYYNTSIFLTFFFFSIAYVLWVLLFIKKRAIIDFKRFDQAADNQSSLIQLISGVEEIKLNNSEKRRRWEWESIQVRLFKLSVKSLSLSIKQNIVGGILIELMNIIITFISVKQVMDGNITFGMMLSVQYIVGQLNLPLTNFITFLHSFQDAKLSFERLAEIHSKEDEKANNSNLINELSPKKEIIIENVSFRYGGKDSPLVLNNITMEIPQGKVTAIVGASGSGKTTLLKLLLRFYEPTEGRIQLDNIDFRKISNSSWRKKCGAVMQDGLIFSDSIARNISEPDADGLINRDKMLIAAQLATIDDFIESLPLGYKTKIGLSGIGISGGQKQRILIARAIYKDPDYIFLDEATSAIDANGERELMENLQAFYKGKTVVIVAHRLSTVKDADQIVVLDKGRIIEHGNHDSLTKLRGSYYSLIKNQLELGR